MQKAWSRSDGMIWQSCFDHFLDSSSNFKITLHWNWPIFFPNRSVVFAFPLIIMFIYFVSTHFVLRSKKKFYFQRTVFQWTFLVLEFVCVFLRVKVLEASQSDIDMGNQSEISPRKKKKSIELHQPASKYSNPGTPIETFSLLQHLGHTWNVGLSSI